MVRLVAVELVALVDHHLLLELLRLLLMAVAAVVAEMF
jgi:hypothetical protein